MSGGLGCAHDPLDFDGGDRIAAGDRRERARVAQAGESPDQERHQEYRRHQGERHPDPPVRDRPRFGGVLAGGVRRWGVRRRIVILAQILAHVLTAGTAISEGAGPCRIQL